MTVKLLEFPRRKELRTEIILEHMHEAGYNKAVIFSCGNASKQLLLQSNNPKYLKFDILTIAPEGALTANRWFTPEEIKRIWPDRFDATSGHLPLYLMAEIAKQLAFEPGRWLGCEIFDKREYHVPTGSGETILCLRLAFPQIIFNPVYNLSPNTKYEPKAPLNFLVGR